MGPHLELVDDGGERVLARARSLLHRRVPVRTTHDSGSDRRLSEHRPIPALPRNTAHDPVSRPCEQTVQREGLPAGCNVPDGLADLLELRAHQVAQVGLGVLEQRDHLHSPHPPTRHYPPSPPSEGRFAAFVEVSLSAAHLVESGLLELGVGREVLEHLYQQSPRNKHMQPSPSASANY